MTNTVLIFLATLLFLAFGYASIVRIAYRQYFSKINGTESEVISYLSSLINSLGQGAIFTCFAATSILLFWGWGLALLWLIAFHLLAETAFNLQSSTAHLKAENKQPTTPRSELNKLIIESVWDIYVLLIATIVIALLVNLINQQTGLVFALIALFPAHLLLRNADSGNITRLGIGISIAALLLGFLFSHKLGISIYGGFNPVESLGFPELANGFFSWLRFDNASIITIAIIISGIVLSGQNKFRSDLNQTCGILIIVILVFLVLSLIWLRPLIDAPLNSAQAREPGLPAFSGLGLFLFAGLSVLLIRDNNSNQKKTVYKKITDSLDEKDDPAPTNFLKLQLYSLTTLLFATVILLVLAAAIGIGAWSTHYLDWTNAGNLFTHFNLALNSLLTLLDADFGSIGYSLFVCSLAFTGFALLLNIVSRLGRPRAGKADQTSSIISQLQQSKVVPAIIIYLICSYLIQNGISIDLWIVTGMLAWLLVTDRIIENALTYQDLKLSDSRNQMAQSAISFIFIIVGCFQVILTGLRWANNAQFGYAAFSTFILILALLSWKNIIIPLITIFKSEKGPELFS